MAPCEDENPVVYASLDYHRSSNSIVNVSIQCQSEGFNIKGLSVSCRKMMVNQFRRVSIGTDSTFITSLG